jgi:hypothetical protein
MLEYVALGILIVATLVLFYGVIAIHDIPYEIAVHRNHPHSDAIHVAGWVSLFTLHVLWPFLWIWATLYREDRGWGLTNHITEAESKIPDANAAENIQAQLDALDARIKALVNSNPAERSPSIADTDDTPATISKEPI